MPKRKRATKLRSPEQEAVYLTTLLEEPRNKARLDWIYQRTSAPADRLPELRELAKAQGHAV